MCSNPATHLARVRDARRGEEHGQHQESDCLPKLAHRDTVACLLHAVLCNSMKEVLSGPAASSAPSDEPPSQAASNVSETYTRQTPLPSAPSSMNEDQPPCRRP